MHTAIVIYVFIQREIFTIQLKHPLLDISMRFAFICLLYIIRIESAINSVNSFRFVFVFICRCAARMPVFVKFTIKCRDKRERNKKTTTTNFSLTRMPFDREARFQNRYYGIYSISIYVRVFAIIFFFFYSFQLARFARNAAIISNFVVLSVFLLFATGAAVDADSAYENK